MIFLITLILALLFVRWPWNLVVIGLAATFEAALAFFGVHYARSRKIQVGIETMVGSSAETIGPLDPDGQVKVDGTIWEARAATPIPAGTAVRVSRIDGLTLEVEPEPEAATKG